MPISDFFSSAFRPWTPTVPSPDDSPTPNSTENPMFFLRNPWRKTPITAPDLTAPSNAPSYDAFAPRQSQPNLVNDVYMPQLRDAATRYQSALDAPHAGTLRQVLGAVLSRRNPALGGVISGELGRQRNIQSAAQDYDLINNIVQQNRALQMQNLNMRNIESEIKQRDTASQALPYRMALEAAQAEAANYKDDPNLGLIDLRTKQPVNPAAMAPLSEDEANVLGKQAGDRVPLKLKNTANEIVNRGYTTINTEEGVFEKQRGKPQMTRLGANPKMMFAPENRIVPVAADPTNPGKVTFMRAGQAMSQGAEAPTSADTVAARSEARSEVPTKIGDQKVAFNTMIAHADLLDKAAKALQNGDSQTLAGLKNAFKNEFGYAGPITAQAIADAYGGEVTNVIAKGHITDKEMEKTGKTLNPSKQNYETIHSVLNAYKSLAQSKMKMLQQQADAVRHPNAPASNAEQSSGGVIRSTDGSVDWKKTLGIN